MKVENKADKIATEVSLKSSSIWSWKPAFVVAVMVYGQKINFTGTTFVGLETKSALSGYSLETAYGFFIAAFRSKGSITRNVPSESLFTFARDVPETKKIRKNANRFRQLCSLDRDFEGGNFAFQLPLWVSKMLFAICPASQPQKLVVREHGSLK